MVFRNKIKNLVFVLLLSITLLCAGLTVACGKAEEKIVLISEIESAIVTKEYDTKSIVSDSNGYEVVLIECYYLDETMQRVDIPIVAGTKFTPTVEREVFVTLKIKGGKVIAETTIPVEAPSTPEQEEFIKAWNDEGVGKSLTANSDYLINGASSSIKVTYTGSLGSNISGPGIGGFNYNEKSTIPFTVTDWSNAVLVMDIFNPGSENLVIYYCIIKDKATWTSDVTGMYGQQRFAVLPAGQWTKAVLSLNMIGIDFNPFVKYRGTMNISFRVGHETLPSVKPYQWSLYLANMDITDYSQERFPDLQTKRFDQILDEMNGEASDKDIYSHLLEENTDFRYIGIKTAGEIVSYASESLSKPSADTGDYVNKYTVTAKADDDEPAGKVIYSTPLYFNQNGRYQLNAEQKNIDYEKGEISFDIYNPNEFALPVYLVGVLASYINLSQYGATAKALSWTTITFPLSHLSVGSTYTFAVSVGGFRTQYQALNYYIDNVVIREVDPPDANDAESLTHLYADSLYFTTTGAQTVATAIAYKDSGVDKPDGVTGDTLIKYDFTSTNVNDDGMLMDSTPLRYSNGTLYPFSETQRALDFSRTVLSFYVYNPNAFDFTIYFAYAPKSYYNTANKGSIVAKAGQWTKVDVDLSKFTITIGETAASDKYEIYMGCGATRYKVDSITYYIDDVTIYEKELDPNGLTIIEKTIAEQGQYAFETSTIGADENGIAWIKVDNKNANMTKGKNYLRVTVNFNTFGTEKAYCYTAGINLYKISWIYRHGNTTVFSYNDYGSKAIVGTFNAKNEAQKLATGLKVYSGETCIMDHNSSSAWSYHLQDGRLVTGIDYVFEYDLNNCAGDLEINFGASAVIKAVEWVA